MSFVPLKKKTLLSYYFLLSKIIHILQLSKKRILMKKLNKNDHNIMARPIPDMELRNLSAKELPKLDENTLIPGAANRIPRRSTKPLLLGTLSGWVSGVIVTKLGKISAFGLGGGVILLYFASELGYISVNWDRVAEALSHSKDTITCVHDFTRRNSCFSVGFVGGFLFGISMV